MVYAQRLVCKGSPSFTLSKSSRGGEGGCRERLCVLSCSPVPSPGVVSPRGVCPCLLSAHAFHPSLLLPPGLVAFPSHLGAKCCAERIQEAGRAGRVTRRASCLTFLCSSPYEGMSSVPKAHLTWHQKESCPPSRAVAGQLGSRQDAQGQPTASLSSWVLPRLGFLLVNYLIPTSPSKRGDLRLHKSYLSSDSTSHLI